ncbi:MAG: Wzt carbohydrate-binding domain-containing protein [Pseudomonadales bacterium]
MAVQALPANDRYGDGDIQITGFSFFDDQGEARHTLVTGENASALIRFACRDTVTEPVAVIAIYRPDGICAMQVISSRSGYHFPLLKSDGGIRVDFQPLTLGPGEYVVSIALFKELNLASSVEPPAHDLHDRCYPLKMLPPVGIQVEIGVVNQTAEWHIVQ